MALALSTGLASAAVAAEPECAPWPGEPRPLPQAAATDIVAARWAALRAEELARLAESAEPHSRTVAHSFWLHVACLEPERPGLDEALARTLPVRVVRPELALLSELAPGPRGTPAEAARLLAAPVALVGLQAVPPPVGAGGPSATARAENAAAKAEAALGEARFAAALAQVEQARRQLPQTSGSAPMRAARARLEVAGATAALALGRDAEAREGFARALALEPDLQLDPSRHAPKVVRIFRSVRASGEAGP